jgi:hypothetical protein
MTKILDINSTGIGRFLLSSLSAEAFNVDMGEEAFGSSNEGLGKGRSIDRSAASELSERAGGSSMASIIINVIVLIE